MHKDNRITSPGVKKLIPSELQQILWSIYDHNPEYLPCIFDLTSGNRFTQKIKRICLLPFFQESHTVSINNPLDNLRITIFLNKNDGTLTMRLSNKFLEKTVSEKMEGNEGFRQGELF